MGVVAPGEKKGDKDNNNNNNNGSNVNCFKLTTTALYRTSMEHTTRTALVSMKIIDFRK